MIQAILFSAVISLALVFTPTNAHAGFGKKYCNHYSYYCIKVSRGETWQKLFPNARERNIVKRVNRMNIRLYQGAVIAVPKNLSRAHIDDFAPFPKRISTNGRKTIVVNQRELAWAAYDSSGRMVRWGPASGGKAYCADVGRGCRTVTGSFTMQRKKGASCASSKYPIGRGGAKMPYCMFFHGGYAIHASPSVPGYHASHGCVRVFYNDAKWLNLNFIDLGSTKVVVQPL